MRIRRLSIATVAVVTVVLGLPTGSAGASGSVLVAGPYHGGGLPESGPVLSYLRVLPGGERFEAAITLRAACDAYPLPLEARVSVTGAELEGDGSAVVTRAIEGVATGPDGQAAKESGESTVAVRFGRGGRVSGTVRIASTFTDAADGSELARCDSGEVAFRARVVPAAAPRAGRRLPPTGTELLGLAGTQPLVALTGARGDLEGLAFVYRSGCQPRADGRGTRRVVFVPGFAVRADGTFRVRTTQRLFGPGGEEERVRIDLRGRYAPGQLLHGAVRLRGERSSGSGEEDEPVTCDSRALRLRALP